MEGSDMMILGKAFLLNVYATFFLDRHQIWIASLHKQQAAALFAKKQQEKIFSLNSKTKTINANVWDISKIDGLIHAAT